LIILVYAYVLIQAGVRTKVLVAQIQHVLGYVCGVNTTNYF